MGSCKSETILKEVGPTNCRVATGFNQSADKIYVPASDACFHVPSVVTLTTGGSEHLLPSLGI